MCKGAKKTKKKGEKTEKAEVKSDDEAPDAARIAKFKADLAARSPPTVYRPDESSKRALAKIPGFEPSDGGDTTSIPSLPPSVPSKI